MTIVPYEKTIRPQFTALLVDYFRELDDSLPEHFIRGKLLDLLLRQQEAGILHIAVAMEDTPIGFSLFQIDVPESDWCKCPGWGCIREFYIAPAYRRRGYGKALADFSESQLHRLGAKKLYLTADTASGFWAQCGYGNTHEICSNDLEIFTK